MAETKRAPRLDRLRDPTPHARVLSNGSLSTLVSGAGGGFVFRHAAALTGFEADRTADGIGVFVYLRDAESGRVWSATHQPTRVAAESYRVEAPPGTLRVERVDAGIESTLEICVDPHRDAEIRRLRLRNRSTTPRAIEVTTYAEVVLLPLAAHLAHPAFAKLFVETELADEEGVLLARRRPRSRGEPTPWLAHAMSGDAALLELETDRVRFVGRGRTLARPVALDGGRLSGTLGRVLDPVLSLRRLARLEPDAEASFVAVLAGGDGRKTALEAARAALPPEEVERALGGARSRERALRDELGLTTVEADWYQEIAAALLYRAPVPALSSDPEVTRAYWKALALDLEPPTEAGTRAPPPTPARGRKTRARPVEPPPPDPDATLVPRPTNGFGAFSADGREYVLRLGPGERPPMPWANVIANERFGTLVSESGAATTWSENSRLNRLTPWSNDPVVDPHGEALYLRDEHDDVYWSPLPGPVEPGGTFEVRHGFGISRWRHESRGLEQSVSVLVARRDPLKLTTVRLRNRSGRPRRLSLFSYAELVLGDLRAEAARTVTTEIDATGVVLARNPSRDDFPGRITFAAAAAPEGASVHRTTDRASFLGRNGAATRPTALETARELDGRAGTGLDPCAAFQVELELAPGEGAECTFLLGEARSREQIAALVDRYGGEEAAAEAEADVVAFWSDVTSRVQVETPVPAIDRIANGWLLHQALSCRLWGRTAFYQSGGAFGFRDQLQDAAALVYTLPGRTRAQIVLHAGQQFVEGDVLHWWHPPAGRGTRTRCSDDRLWLPYVTAFYVGTTGDDGVLDEEAPLLRARALEDGEDETYLLPRPSGEEISVYEHCVRAIERSLERGANGLPLIGTCDWNDGFNRVGRQGRGESVWLAFFLHAVLEAFEPIAERRGDGARARRWREHRDALRAAVEERAWDGEWYRRATYDDGTWLGGAASTECRIDALAQSWAVISRAARPERAERAMDATVRELVDEEGGLVRLLTPPFDDAPEDPGYIKGYVPGIRENGGQYTHGALWVVRALAELGRRDAAARVLEMLSPVTHTATAEGARRYAVEPYVVAADVYSTPPHVGRGGWTWYTGSAAWTYRVALESILGFTLDAGRWIRLRPRIPDAWPRVVLRYRLDDGTRYEIVVGNPKGAASEVVGVLVDGKPGAIERGAARIPLRHDGEVHRVQVTLGSVPSRAPR